MHGIRRQTGIGYTDIIIIRRPTFLAQHGRKIMLVYHAAIRNIILELPECTAVLLNTTIVTVALPTTKVHHRFITFTSGSTNIIAQFRMPHQILYRCYLKEDITCQLLAVQQHLVHHSHCYRVRIRVTFTHNGRIISVYIVNRNIRDSFQ